MLRNSFLTMPTMASQVLEANGLGGMAFKGMMPTPPEDGEPPVEITPEHMTKWNKLIAFAKDKGYAGKPELDHNPILRKKVFEEFNKENPDYAIPIEMVKPIQNEIQAYKQKALTDIKSHPESFAGKPENFMKGISQVDGIFGQLTSQWAFPQTYIDKAKSKSVGFAPKVGRQALLEILKK